MVLWVMAHRWPPVRCRAFLFAMFATIAPLHLAILAIYFGSGALYAMLLGLLVTPFVYAGSWLGLRLGNQIPRQKSRQVTYSLLTLIACSAIVSPWYMPRLESWWGG